MLASWSFSSHVQSHYVRIASGFFSPLVPCWSQGQCSCILGQDMSWFPPELISSFRRTFEKEPKRVERPSSCADQTPARNRPPHALRFQVGLSFHTTQRWHPSVTQVTAQFLQIPIEPGTGHVQLTSKGLCHNHLKSGRPAYKRATTRPFFSSTPTRVII